MRPWLLASAVALVAATPPIWPYAYYTLLRVLVCGVSIGAIVMLRADFPGLAAAFVLVALLFNPIIPVYLDKAVWVIIDIAAAIFFFVATSHPQLAGVRKQDGIG